MQTYIKQKNRYRLRLFMFSNDIEKKNNTEIIENHSEFLGAKIAAISSFQFDLDKSRNYV